MINENIARVLERVQSACVKAGRDPNSVQILLATKTQDVSTIAQALAIMPGRVIIGENRVQELVNKCPELPNAEIHFIGPLQKNKINALLATPVSCIETIDSIELAEALSSRLERQAGPHDDGEQVANAGLGRPMDVMVQVNVSGEPTKAGCLPDDAAALALAVAELPMLNLTGFMTIGLRPIIVHGEITNSDEIKSGYRQLRGIRDSINPYLELSMGMSTDLELAIAEGATIVRIGSAIFGSRTI